MASRTPSPSVFGELFSPIDKATLVYCDNVSAVYLSANPIHHRRTKHVELDILFVRERVALGEFWVLHIPTRQQLADIMMKGLPSEVFSDFRSSLFVAATDVTTAWGVLARVVMESVFLYCIRLR